MNKLYSILMQKTEDGAPLKDLYDDFGVACTETPFDVGGEVKELSAQDWLGEDGEDTYFPDTLPIQAYDLEINCAYKGELDTARTKLSALRDYLIGRDGYGTELMIYIPYSDLGRAGVYMKQMGDFEHFRGKKGDVTEFTLTMRVTKPTTDVATVTDSAGTITGLATTA